MLTSTTPLAFDGRDVTDAVVPDEVLGFGLLACPHCGTLRNAWYPYCCEFAGEPAPEPLLVTR
jgi:hypothetical protein